MRLSLASLLLALVGSCGGQPPAELPPPPPPAPLTPPTAAPGASATAAAPSEVGISLEQLLDVQRAFSPRAIDGERFAFLSDAPGTPQLYLSTKDKPAALTSFPDRLSGLRVAPGGKTAVFLKDAGGDENDQIHLIELTPTAPPITALTDAPKVKHSLPVFDDTGARIAFTSNARNGTDMDLYVETLKGLAPGGAGKKPLVELKGSHTVAAWRGDRVVVTEVRSSFDQDLWLVDVKTGKKKLLTAHESPERHERAQFSRDGKAVFTSTDGGREFIGVTAIDLASQKRTPVLELDFDVAEVSVAPPQKGTKGDLLVFSINEGGTEKVTIVELDEARKQVRRTATSLAGVIGGIDVAPSGGAAFVAFETPKLPAEIFRLDTTTGESARVTRSDHAGIDESRLLAETLDSFTTSDAKKVAYFWYASTAPAGTRQPVVVIVHGGPEGQSQPLFSPLTQYLALHGYAVAMPNVRGSSGYGKTFHHLDDKDKREDSVRDLHELGEVLAKRADVDPSRIALYGGSYGGYMVLAGLTLYPEQWAAGVDVVGISNFRTFLEQTAPYRRALREQEYGSLATDSALLDRVSPIHKVDRIRAPVMVIHGTRDPRVPIHEARQITDALKKRGLPVELLTFEDEGHGLSKRKNRIVAYKALVAFLDQHLKKRK